MLCVYLPTHTFPFGDPQGEEQARYLRDFLATVKADLVVTSELIRTQETARIVLEKQVLHPPLIAVPDLREISWGSMEGTNTADVHGLVQSWNTGDFDGILSHCCNNRI